MLPKADKTPGGDHTATGHSEDPEIEPEENFPPVALLQSTLHL